MENSRIEKFLSVEDQIKLLISRGLKFKNLEKSKFILSSFGYYEIINGYREPFLLGKDEEGRPNKERFQNNINFEDIYKLFSIDNDMRDSILSVTIMFELHFRQIIIRAFSETYSESQEDYLDHKKFRIINKLKDYLYLLNKLNKAVYSEESLFAYHRKNHGNIPLWVLFKSKDIHFAELIIFY